ncbi:uncharacterized protein LOC112084424 [Eutrema salsugineum]|uniref:uncharacterized protein LOC112084424 n=1 Tax=Eutrema salsugineum TaxID=72664 RepID=UPI000CED71B2|nr:uncharacterized protein LOC112084424 [Eutrema salsugineum]
MVKAFRSYKDRYNIQQPEDNFKLVVIANRNKDARTHNMPTSTEVAALIPGDFQEGMDLRDIVLETTHGNLRRISEIYVGYLALQYPLLFPFGEDGFTVGIEDGFDDGNKRKRKTISMREFYAYRIQDRLMESQSVIRFKRLYQQFLVDVFTMIESSRLRYFRKNQKKLCSDKYVNLVEAEKEGNSDLSNRGMYTIEFQKRGLPHAHILLWMAEKNKLSTAESIDKVISAEIPDKDTDPSLYEVVKQNMIHGPCGVINKSSPCMVNGKCSKLFPKKYCERTTIDNRGFPHYMRRKTGAFVEKNGLKIDNSFVVPYNRELSLRYRVNVEWCTQARSIKYLFKYINKGPDRVLATIENDLNQGADSDACANVDENGEDTTDEIKEFFDCRYVSSCEATWCLLAFLIHFRTTPVEKLYFHLENKQSVLFDDDDPVETVLNRRSVQSSMLLAFFEACNKYPEAENLTYAEFPTMFVYDRTNIEWKPRQQKNRLAVGRITYVPLKCGQLYYLRVLLNRHKCPKGFDDLKTVDGVLHPTYKDACYALGLLDDDREYIDGINEASMWGSGDFLRKLFCVMLLTDSLINPFGVWEETWNLLSDDILYRRRSIENNPELDLSDEQLKNYTLDAIETILRSNGCSLSNYDGMPLPDGDYNTAGINRLIYDERNYDREEMKAIVENMLPGLTDEQMNVYKEIMEAVTEDKGRVFFLYGFGGTGKTHLWKLLSAAVRARGEIVLNVASSGIAYLLLPGGRTAHSRFGIPINPDDDTTCNIQPGTDLGNLVAESSLIIWDEAPMMSRYCFESLDCTMRDIIKRHKEKPFRGKVVVFGGDFRQILPVISGGGREDIVMASINSSYLWDDCKVLKLTKNMRLLANLDESVAEEIKSFSEWILKFGDGKINLPNTGEVMIDIPDELLIKECDDPIQSIVEEVYGLSFEEQSDPHFYEERAILCPTNDDVCLINDYMLSMLTEVEDIDPVGVEIVQDFVSFSDVHGDKTEPGLPIDIHGFVISIDPLVTVNDDSYPERHDKKTTSISFTLKDYKGLLLSCVALGPLALDFNYKIFSEEQLLFDVMLTDWSVKQEEDGYYLRSRGGISRIEFHPDCPKAKTLVKRFWNNQNKPTNVIDLGSNDDEASTSSVKSRD